jgi:hypothetical protein
MSPDGIDLLISITVVAVFALLGCLIRSDLRKPRGQK